MTRAFVRAALLVSALSSLAVGLSNGISHYNHYEHPNAVSNNTYDYIIVGGGTSGLTVANRLTEDPNFTVLVIEYGYLDNNYSVLIPYEANFNNYRDLWNITSLPIPGLNNEPYPVLSAATVGGGSVVNGMFFDRASAADYNAWEELGNPGWGWEGLLPYFKKSANFTIPSPAVAAEYNYTWDAAYWGRHGPVQASIAPFQWPEQSIYWRAFAELGITDIDLYPRDGADGSGVGVFWVPNSEDPVTETRSDARTAYYNPAASRPNLHLLTGTQVKTVTFSGKSASGVTMMSREDNSTVSATARKEVIMAAGAIFTPQILQLSGIGPRSVLEPAGITVMHELPGVGSNFQDHPTAYMEWNLTNDFSPNPETLMDNTTYNAEQRAIYFKNRTGPYIQAHGNSAAFFPLRTISPDVDEIVAMIAAQNTSANLPSTYTSTNFAGYSKQHAIMLGRLNGTEAAMYEFPFAGQGSTSNAMEKPLSRGSITLNRTDPFALPIVEYGTLNNPIDGIMAVAMVNFTRRFYKTETMAQLAPVEVSPGANYTSTSELLSILEQSVLSPTFAHPSCSCPMMPLEYGGVVSPEVLVYGLQHLSIVDNSVFPIIPATHLQASVYAVAEKAADLIKSRAANDAHGVW